MQVRTHQRRSKAREREAVRLARRMAVVQRRRDYCREQHYRGAYEDEISRLLDEEVAILHRLSTLGATTPVGLMARAAAILACYPPGHHQDYDGVALYALAEDLLSSLNPRPRGFTAKQTNIDGVRRDEAMVRYAKAAITRLPMQAADKAAP